MKITILVITIFAISFTNGDAIQNYLSKGDNEYLMSSTHQLKVLLNTELQVIKELKSYQKLLQNEIQVVENLVKAHEKSVDSSQFDADEYIQHPINALGVIRRMQMENFYGFLTNSTLEKSRENIKNLVLDIAPSIQDYDSACNSIALIQEAYQLETKDLVQGKIVFRNQTFQSSYQLDIHDKTNIGNEAMNRVWYDIGITWLQESLNHAKKEKRKDLISKIDLNVRQAIQAHDHMLDKRGVMGEKHRTFPVPFSAKLKKKKKFKNAQEKYEKLLQEKLTPLYETRKGFMANFHALCQNASALGNKNIDGSLICKHQHYNDPFLKLAPFKLEEHHLHPYLVTFKNFLSESETDYLISMAKDNLKQSEVKAKTAVALNVRTSKQAWLVDRHYYDARHKNITEKVLPSNVYYLPSKDKKDIYSTKVIRFENATALGTILSKRIALATQLSIMGPYSSEAYQIANYGVGGQYQAHHDSHKGNQDEKLNNQGGRIATVMAYLSDVKSGGDTVFPWTGISLPPEKGTAVFWSNIDRTGVNVDDLTLHGGCPVLVGSKWITNKWIRSFDQGLKIKCGLEVGTPMNLYQHLKQIEVRNKMLF